MIEKFVGTAMKDNNIKIKSFTCIIINQLIIHSQELLQKVIDNSFLIKEIFICALDINYEVKCYLYNKSYVMKQF